MDQPALDQVLRGARLKTLRSGKKEVDLNYGARYTPGQAETSPKRIRKRSVNGIGCQSANKAITLRADQKRGSLAQRESELNGHRYRQEEPAPSTRGE